MMQPEIAGAAAPAARACRPPSAALRCSARCRARTAPIERIERYTRAGDALHMAYTLRPMRGSRRRTVARPRARRDRRCRRRRWHLLVVQQPRCRARRQPLESGAARRRRRDPAFVRLLHGDAAGAARQRLRLSGRGARPERGGARPRAICAIPSASPTIPNSAAATAAARRCPWRADADACRLHHRHARGCRCRRDHRAASVAAQERNARSALHAWRDLAAWRKAHPALQEGDLTPLDLPAPLLGFTRACAEESLVLVFNPSAHAARVSLNDHPGVTIVDDAEFAALLDGDVILLPPYGVFVGALDAAAATRPHRAGRRLAAACAGGQQRPILRQAIAPARRDPSGRAHDGLHHRPFDA